MDCLPNRVGLVLINFFHLYFGTYYLVLFTKYVNTSYLVALVIHTIDQVINRY